MNPEIATLLLPIGKFILAASLLVLFYQLFYKGKATYNECRIYLLSIAVMAILLSQFQIVVYTPPVNIVQVEAPQVVTFDQGKDNTPSIGVKAGVVSPVVVEKPSIWSQILDFLTPHNLVVLVYGLTTLILIFSFLIQYFKIISIKRKGVVRQKDGFEIVENAEVPTPFSFCRSIFIGNNLSGNKLEVILKHEQWHIRHRHYVDLMVMEMVVRLFWFNPVFWWIRKELRNVSEFQADRSVLDEGHDLYKYQTIILEEVMEHNPNLANGFNNSFTKKRFIMMKNSYSNRFTALRRTLLVPFLVSVFALLCFTTGKSETKYVMNTAQTPPIPQTKITTTSTVVTTTSSIPMDLKAIDVDSMLDHAKSGALKSNLTVKMDDISKLSEDEIDRNIKKTSESFGIAIAFLDKAAKATDPLSRKVNLLGAFNNLDIKFNNQGLSQTQLSDKLCESITTKEIETTKTDLINAKNKMDALRKDDSKDRKVQGMGTLMLSLFQSPLFSKVLNSMLQGLSSQLGDMMAPLMSQLTGDPNKAIDQSNLKNLINTMIVKPTVTTTTTTTTTSKDSKETVEEKTPNNYQLKPEQIQLCYIPFDPNPKIMSIVKAKNETKVVLAVPILDSDAYFGIDKCFSIMDAKTQDRYMIRKLEGDLPLSTIVDVKGLNRKMLKVVLVFPPLKKGVELINIADFSDGTVLPQAPPNPWAFWKIKVKDYIDKGGKATVYE